MFAPDTTDDDRPDPDDYPLESSPSTGSGPTAVLNHAVGAHAVSEYHEPPERMTRETSTPTDRGEQR